MTHQFALSPDVNVRDLSHWFVLNTRIQKLAGESLHLCVFDDFGEFHRAIEGDAVDLVFANAADAAELIRDRGFLPLAAPAGVADEALIAVAEEGAVRTLADLADSPLDAVAADAPDVERICRILLEPVNVAGERLRISARRNPVLVAKALLNGEAKAGFFLASAFAELADATRRQLRPVATSHIYVVRHSLLVGPRLAPASARVMAALREISANGDDAAMLKGVGAPDGWAPFGIEEAEFLIDLMETLKD